MLAFLISPLGRKLAAAALVLALLLGAAWYFYSKGQAAGFADGQRAQLDLDRQQFEQDRAEFLKKLDEYKVENDRLNQRLADQDAHIHVIRADRSAVRDAVSRMTAPQISAELSALDQREVLQMVKGYPKLAEELRATQDKLSTLEAKVANESKRADAAAEAYNRLVPLYAKAYNAAQKKHSLFVKIISLGLVRDKHLDLPAPGAIQ